MSDIVIDRDWFKVWDKAHYPKTRKDIGSVLSMYSPWFLDDSEGDDNGSYTAAVTLGVFDDDNNKTSLMLFSLFPPSMIGPGKTIQHAKNLCFDYVNNSEIRMHGSLQPDLMIVPGEKGVSNNLVKEIMHANGDVHVGRFFYKEHGKTLDNMVKRALRWIYDINEKGRNMGRIYLMSHPSNKGELRNMDESFLFSITSYPSPISKALMWAFCQAIIYLDSNGLFDEPISQIEIGEKRRLYGI